jgi:hypothetical protein
MNVVQSKVTNAKNTKTDATCRPKEQLAAKPPDNTDLNYEGVSRWASVYSLAGSNRRGRWVFGRTLTCSLRRVVGKPHRLAFGLRLRCGHS